MMNGTYATLFTGGDGWGVGFRAAGLRGLWGVEIDPAIAAVATANGARNVHAADVLDMDWDTCERPDVLAISQPCTRFSSANTQAGESPLDVALARKSLQAIEVLQPRYVLIENVPQFAGSASAGLLLDGLWAAGYWVHSGTVNAADFGVPQTRRRFIIRAVRGGGLPMLPAPVPWVGWYAAIADLVPTLPADTFAPWQAKRLPAQLASPGYIIGGGNTSDASLDSTWHSSARPVAAPMFTVTAGDTSRAFLVNGQNARSAEKGGMAVLPANEPSMVIPTAGRGVMRAWLAAGRVVRMTPRALARFQSFPDTYQLPTAPALAAKVIGNAVPCLLAQRLVESLVM